MTLINFLHAWFGGFFVGAAVAIAMRDIFRGREARASRKRGPNYRDRWKP